MTEQLILAALREHPATAHDLAARFGAPQAVVRNTLAELVFRRDHRGRPCGVVTCGRDGRYRLGDPRPLLEVS